MRAALNARAPVIRSTVETSRETNTTGTRPEDRCHWQEAAHFQMTRPAADSRRRRSRKTPPIEGLKTPAERASGEATATRAPVSPATGRTGTSQPEAL